MRELLIYPLGITFSLSILGLLLWQLKRLRLAIILVTCALSWLLCWSLPPVARALQASLEQLYPAVPVEQIPTADVIVVFGGVMKAGDAYYPYPGLTDAADRAWHAARLFKAGKAPKILLSGGLSSTHTDGLTEAELMRLFLLDLGVPDEAIVLETRSRSTRENALYCAAMVRDAGWSSVILVTSALHMPRAWRSFKQAGVEAIPVGTDYQTRSTSFSVVNWLPTAGALEKSTHALHEVIGTWTYAWRGWLAPDS
jgi:uncharacterized SAM-binding protein YcdF (DUF218 family)